MGIHIIRLIFAIMGVIFAIALTAIGFSGRLESIVGGMGWCVVFIYSAWHCVEAVVDIVNETRQKV